MNKNIDIFKKRQFMIHADYEIYHYSDPANLKVIPHMHDFYELYYLLSDHIDFAIGKQVFSLSKGDFLLIPPGITHYPNKLNLVLGMNYERIVLWCSLPFFEKMASIDDSIYEVWHIIQQEKCYLFQTLSSNQTIYTLLNRLLEEQQNPSNSSNLYSFALISELFTLINRNLHTSTEKNDSKNNQYLFNDILYYIHTHLTEELSLELLSGVFFISKSYISKIFKENLGISLYKYVLQLRLEGSRNAILSGTPIQKAAEIFGFNDYSAYYRAFKNTFDASPRDYVDKSKKI